MFEPEQGKLLRVIKGISGNPICMDVSGLNHNSRLSEQRDLIAVAYEDDSFIVYSVARDFLPVCRGVGHRAFIG